MNWEEHLKELLKDPEFAALFACAQRESARELFECGVSNYLDETSLNNKAKKRTWKKVL